ncbi:DUF1330 domain-containing protein [Bacteroidota bacterium]
MYYFIAQIRINDQAEYQKYIDGVDDVFSRYNGKYLAVDDDPKVLEGNWNYTRSVLIGFETREDFEDWYNSDEYQEILKHRLSAAKCDSILVNGSET